MIAYQTNFETIDENWHWNYPWGTPDNELGKIHPTCLSVVNNGLLMTCKQVGQRFYAMPRIFWTGTPFGYGLFEAEMTVPFQGAVPDFVLYSKAKYKRAVRSILPEIDIAEFGTKKHPIAINMAVHRWQRKPDFLQSPKYPTEKRHELDYANHIQKNKMVVFESLDIEGTQKLYQCEVTKRSVKIYINGAKMFHQRVRIEACFTPTLGISVPDWNLSPNPKWMIVHNFKVEQ